MLCTPGLRSHVKHILQHLPLFYKYAFAPPASLEGHPLLETLREAVRSRGCAAKPFGSGWMIMVVSIFLRNADRDLASRERIRVGISVCLCIDISVKKGA